MSMMVRLYPSAWRARYGDELDQLLTDRPPSLADRLDLARGALDARLHPQRDRPSRAVDRRGYAPLIGLAMLAAAIFVGANGPLMRDEFGTYRDGGAALPLFIGAMLLLCVGLFAIVERVPADRAVVRWAGWVAIGSGLLWSLGPWNMVFGLTFLLGLAVVAVGGRRAGDIGTPATVGLIAAIVGPAGMLLATLFLPWYALRVVEVNLLVVLGPLAAIWLVVGSVALRGRELATPA
jgi:hypothetical protein